MGDYDKTVLGRIEGVVLKGFRLKRRIPRRLFVFSLVLAELLWLQYVYPTICWDIKMKYIVGPKEAQNLFFLLGLLPAFFLWSWRDGDKKLDIENQRVANKNLEVSNENQTITHNQTNFHKLVEWLLSGDEAQQLGSVPQFLPFLEGKLGEQFQESAKEVLVSFLASSEVERLKEEDADPNKKRVDFSPTVQRIHQLIKNNGPVFANLTLTGIKLRGANLWGANLQQAQLAFADLQETILPGAYFQWAELWGTKLEGANLLEANLEGTNLEGAYYDEKTQFPEGFDPVAAKMREV